MILKTACEWEEWADARGALVETTVLSITSMFGQKDISGVANQGYEDGSLILLYY